MLSQISPERGVTLAIVVLLLVSGRLMTFGSDGKTKCRLRERNSAQPKTLQGKRGQLLPSVELDLRWCLICLLLCGEVLVSGEVRRPLHGRLARYIPLSAPVSGDF